MSAVAATGHNGGPALDPFEAFDAHLSDLLETAKGFLDGEGVTTEAEATAVSRLLDDARRAGKDADTARTVEKKPHDDAGKAVQVRWKPLLERVDLIASTAKKALAPYLKRLEDERRAAAEAARQKAEAAAQAAAEAARAARASDLDAQENAQRLADDTRAAEKAASKAEGQKAHATGGARAIGLQSRWSVELTDPREAARHYWTVNPSAFDAVLRELAAADVRAGKRTIPGFTVTEERVVV